MKLSAIIALTLCSGSTAFTSSSTPNGSSRKVAMNAKKQENTNTVAASAMAAAFILSNAAMFATDIPNANAFDATAAMDHGSSITLAARSGGRAGGRSSAPTARSPAASRRSTTVNNYNTYNRSAAAPSVGYAAPSVIVTPSIGYGYSPFGGIGSFGTGYALGAMGNSGNNMREYQEQRDLAQAKAELEVERQRQAELEARVRAIEAASAGANANVVQQQQQIAK
uniref:Uncharacterized protein n=1 Tax=Leptocylindrus danicus TaxID=163516 RepID=A0A7S2KE28_9STRA|eukprot:CAMPEP_0116024662 /NCGR_PEP_ID=MMETSP0321-20121206/12470_1 /TAXON_ID=163516 /ORGANISM="Leptocylindrus danicus var. danicus, Strain B650" /LENGTH=224 /DNA_ID=CAMNT_0003496475 /DNA_START=63 /DNA_END=737 /DNA_ORIENTATION=-